MYGVSPPDNPHVKEVRCLVLPPQIGTPQIGGAIAGGAFHPQAGQRRQGLLQPVEIHRAVNRVARPRLGLLKRQQGGGGQSVAGAAQADAGTGGKTKAGPRVMPGHG